MKTIIGLYWTIEILCIPYILRTSVQKQLHSKYLHNKKALILNSEWMCPVWSHKIAKIHTPVNAHHLNAPSHCIAQQPKSFTL